jgi:hypothetical protein
MTETEFEEMNEVLMQQRLEVSTSVEAADRLLTELNIKHLLVPRSPKKAEPLD